MIKYLRELGYYLKWVLKSKYRWFLVLFVIWLYRVAFMSDSGEGTAKLIQILTLGGLVMLLYKHGAINYSRYIKRNVIPVKTIFFLYLYALISTIWAFLPSFVFFLAFQNLVFIFLFIWFWNLFHSFHDIERGFLVFATFVLIFMWVSLRIGNFSLFSHQLSGGSTAALLLSYTGGEILSKKRDLYPNRLLLLRGSFLISLIVLVTHTSSGANASALLGLGIGFLFSGNRLWALLIFSIAAFFILNPDYMQDVIFAIMPGKSMKTIETASGRDILWELILQKAEQRPIFGWGFACAERVVTAEGFDAVDSHNNYIGIYGGLGIVGCIILGIHLLCTSIYVFKRRVQPGFLGIFCAICCAILNGYSYGFLSGKTSSITVMYIALIALAAAYGKVVYNDRIIK